MRRLLLLLMFLFVAAPAWATTYYVATTGTNATGGTHGQIGDPWLTIQYGADHLSCGDTLYVRAGTYNGGLGVTAGTETTCSSWGSSILVSAYPSETVTMTNTGQTAVVGVSTNIYPTSANIYWTFQNLIFDGTGGAAGLGGAMASLEASYVRWINDEFTNSQRAGGYAAGDHWEFIGGSSHHNGRCSQDVPVISACRIAGRAAYSHGLYITSPYTTVDGMALYDNSGCGVQFQQSGPGVDYGMLINSTIHDNSFGGPEDPGTGYCEGASIAGNAVGSVAFNNLIYHNYQLGLAIGGSSVCTDCIVANNTIVDNYGAGLEAGLVIRALSKNNIIYGNAGHDIQFDGIATTLLTSDHDIFATSVDSGYGGTLTVTNTNSADPLIVSVPSDMSVSATSYAIGHGLDLSATFTNDYNGATRPSGSPWTIGAIEYSPSTCTPHHLTITVQPTNATLGDSISISIGIYDSGNVHCTSATNTVTLSKHSGQCTGMTLGGTPSGAATAGTFATTVILTVATGACTLDAAASGLTGTTTSSFTLSNVLSSTLNPRMIRN